VVCYLIHISLLSLISQGVEHMDYLAILKNLDAGKVEASSQGVAVGEFSCEKSEICEKSLPAPPEGLVETAAKLPPLGAQRGVLTVADLPELERRLRLSGWKVKRRGYELVCTSPGALRVQ
jgi:hypothetical protein